MTIKRRRKESFTAINVVFAGLVQLTECSTVIPAVAASVYLSRILMRVYKAGYSKTVLSA